MKIYRSINAFAQSAFITSIVGISQVNAATKSPTLNLNTINKMTAKCMQEARKAKHDIAIAIFNDSGVLLSFVKADEASSAAGAVARWKGRSAALYQTSTAETANWNVPTAPSIATVQGGVPIFTAKGTPIGGIGVSGGPPPFDEHCGALAIQSVGLLHQL